jgi:hypothetical protein
MYNRFIIIFSCLLFSIVSMAQTVNTDKTFFDYSYDKETIKKHKIQSVKIEMKFLNDEIFSRQIFSFDRNGLLTKQTILDSIGKPTSEFYYIVDAHSELNYRDHVNYESNKNETDTFFKVYNGNKLISDSSSSMPVKYYYEYDKAGNILKTIAYMNYAVGYEATVTTSYKRDRNNKLQAISETIFRNETKMEMPYSTRLFYYNNAGQLVKETKSMVYESPSAQNTIIYTYNKNGLLRTKKHVIDDEDLKITTIDNFTYTYWK